MVVGKVELWVHVSQVVEVVLVAVAVEVVLVAVAVEVVLKRRFVALLGIQRLRKLLPIEGHVKMSLSSPWRQIQNDIHKDKQNKSDQGTSYTPLVVT